MFERAVGFDASREEHRGVERCARLALGGGEAREGVDRDADHLGRGRVGGVRDEGVEGVRREGVAAAAGASRSETASMYSDSLSLLLTGAGALTMPLTTALEIALAKALGAEAFGVVGLAGPAPSTGG